MLILHSSNILLISIILLNNLVNHTTLISHTLFQTSIKTSSCPIALLLFSFFKASFYPPCGRLTLITMGFNEIKDECFLCLCAYEILVHANLYDFKSTAWAEKLMIAKEGSTTC